MKTFILLTAFGPVREAVAVAEEALAQGREVIFVTFKPEWREILSPLIGEGVSLLELPRDVHFTFKHPIRSFREMTRLLSRCGELEAVAAGEEVYLFGASILLSSVVLAGRLAGVSKTFYSPVYEGRGESWSHLSMPDKSRFRNFKALALSQLTGARIITCRPASPVFALSDDFIASHTRPLPSRSFDGSGLLPKLRRERFEKILLLYTGYPEIWPTTGDEKKQFLDIWEMVALEVRKHFLPAEVVIKAHPKTPSLPDFLRIFPSIDPGLPMEIFEFPKLSAIFFDSSGAVKPWVDYEPSICWSFWRLFKADWRHRLQGMLDENVDPERKCLRVGSPEEMISIFSTLSKKTTSDRK